LRFSSCPFYTCISFKIALPVLLAPFCELTITLCAPFTFLLFEIHFSPFSTPCCVNAYVDINIFLGKYAFWAHIGISSVSMHIFNFSFWGHYPECCLYYPTFRNTLLVPPSVSTQKMEPTRCSETSVSKHNTPSNNPKTRINHLEHGKSLKSLFL
jgi:hypothetical protein